MRVFTVAALGALLATTLVSPASASTGIQQELDQMVAAGTPGVVLTVVRGKNRWRAEAGVSDVDTNGPLPRDGRFRAGSITKTMVATVLLQLVHEGKLALTDTLGELLPGMVPGDDGVRVEQLLNHTSGLADYINAPEFADPAHYTSRTYSPARLIQLANTLEHGAPGIEWAYSNTNYILLGMLVERVTGHTLSQELRWRVFLPAGMFRSDLPTSTQFLAGPHASGYYRIDPAPRFELTELNPSFAWAAYGVVSTATDIQRFYHALFTGKLLPPALVQRMHEDAPATNNPAWPRYGLGIEEMHTTCGVTLWGHTGAIPGYQTYAFATLDGKREIVVSANLFSPRDGRQVLGALNAINIEFCGEPWQLPSVGSGLNRSENRAFGHLPGRPE
ncbi:serine hydrolase domain-containing protein [Actinophytocola sediminis]